MAEMSCHVLHDDDRGVDEHPDRNGEAAQAHEVGGQTECVHQQERDECGERQLHLHGSLAVCGKRLNHLGKRDTNRQRIAIVHIHSGFE